MAIACLATVGVSYPRQVGTVSCVDLSATGSGSGLDWANAFPFLDVALASVQPGTTLLLAEGVYLPDASTSSTLRTATFAITDTIELRGGFLGLSGGPSASTDRLQPDGQARNTILSGDVAGTPFDASDDVYHVVSVVYNPNASGETLLDGMLIRQGFADGPGPNENNGGGVFAIDPDVMISDCFIVSNHAKNCGGGVFATGFGQMHVKRSIVMLNTCSTDGAGLCASYRTRLRVFNDTLRNNTAGGTGGAIRFTSSIDGVSTFQLVNSLVYDNFAMTGAGVSMDTNTDTRVISNCTIAFNKTPNTASTGAGVFVSAGSPFVPVNLHNSIVVFNPNTGGLSGTGTDNVWNRPGTAAFDVQHTNLGNTNILATLTQLNRLNTDPLFASNVARNLTLLRLSPCLEAGNDNLLSQDALDVDEDQDSTERLDVDRRVWGPGGTTLWAREQVTVNPVTTFGVGVGPPAGIVDMGAFEHLYLDPLPPQ